jgi:hypothetical protein
VVVLGLLDLLGGRDTCAQTLPPCPVQSLPIACGELKSGTIELRPDCMTDQDFLTFEAQSGEVVTITVARTSQTAGSFEPAWALRPVSGGIPQGFLKLSHFFTLDPTINTDACGNQLCCRGKCESPPLPATGTFRIQVFDLSPPSNVGDGGGTFDIDLQPVSATFDGSPNGPPSPVCPGTRPIGFGERLAGTIRAVGEADTFTFTALPGTQIAINLRGGVGQNFGPIWQLFGPDGTLLALQGPDDAICRGSPRCCAARCTAPALPEPGGTFTIEVFDYPWDGTGGYDLTLTSCGNGMLESDESCDDGARNGTPTSCCNADCTLRPAGQVCRPAATFCDVAEICDGANAACPADGPLQELTPCNLLDPCTIEDVCRAGSCTAGIQICSVIAGQPCNAPADQIRCETKRPPLRIDVHATINRDRLGLAKGGSFSAVAFERGASGASILVRDPTRTSSGGTITCTALGEGQPDCVAAHNVQLKLTDLKRKKIAADGSAVVRLNLNPLARRALRRDGVLDADVCAKIRFPNDRQIGLRCMVDVRRR